MRPAKRRLTGTRAVGRPVFARSRLEFDPIDQARYTRPDMGAVWSDERRFQRWLDVEIAAMEGWADAGVVPAEAVAAVRELARVDVARILEIERRTHHDVLAFTESVAEQVGEPARWFHYGLTSSDVVDTALALQLRDAGRMLLDGVDAVEPRCSCGPRSSGTRRRSAALTACTPSRPPSA